MSDNSTETLNNSQDDKLDQILAGQQEVRARLEQLETKVDERLRETRPIWEGVQLQLKELKEADVAIQSQIEDLKDAQQSFRAEVEKSFRALDRRMEMYSDMVSRVNLYQRDQEDRVDELAKRLA
ncbi:MAG TPA: hypothetical protein VFB82_18290 [Blastocatellia bacterium]|nr:hypothetical protein [Blastocatellia bacterium]